MNDDQNRQTKAMKRAKQFGVDHPLAPPNADAATAFTALGTAIAQIESVEANRINGTNTSRGAVIERRYQRKALRSTLSDLSRVAKTLDQTAHPDIAAQLKMGRLGSDAALLAFAQNAITVITPIKAVFIGRGAPTTVIEDVQSLIDAFSAATDRRYRGLGTQLSKGAELKGAIREGMAQVRVLDGILSLVLRPTPGLLAEWKAAKRVPRGPHHQPPEPPAPASAGSTSTGSGTGTGMGTPNSGN